MAARERYVDLSPYYDVAAAKARREELIALTDRYRASYRDAYHVLRALGGVDAERRAAVRPGFDERKLLRRAEGIAGRELRGKNGKTGRCVHVFLGGMTCKGCLCRFDTVDSLCPRVYELCDSYGLGQPALRLLRRAAVDAGLDVIVCRDPDRPEEMQHLLIPSRGLAFVTTNESCRREERSYRRLRIDAMAEEGLTHAQKAHLRFIRRIRRVLAEEAVSALACAKCEHDALEELYRPCVDFEGVGALCEAEIARIESRVP